MRYLRRGSVAAGLAALVALSGLPGPGPAQAQPPAEAAAGPSQALVESHTVTLVTGDRVEVQRFADGRQAATVEPGAGRETMGFHQQEVDGDLTVIPEDAVPYVASRRLDRALFNLTELIADGYDDARSTTLPVIVGYPKGITARSSFTAAAAGPVLESINARAVAVSRTPAFWESVDDDRAAVRSGRTSPVLAGGADRIWLDRKIEADLDRSVPQVGAPAAWQAGYDGTGVTVAVLDTGIDANHPDVAGTLDETKNFTPSADAVDRFGHGTHVAATVLGRGTGSTPARKGVAPGARLLAGKVLGDDGTGQTSWIVAGMEWAAASGAKVVNMSLGGGPTDGTDPLAQALNRITATTGTLFVTSAGNDGRQGEFTVGTPGSADAALTVGAVDRDESLADFSSRGPRVGDFAIKPDVTAPGVGIVAARAAGTAMGTPVDALYTAANGTSMAAPHVAGAAAILAQQHPGWTAQQLKDALASTAVRNTDLTVYQQGGGRIDLARATSQPVTGTGTLDLGVFGDDDTEPAGKQVTYTNTSAEPVTLDLRLSQGTPGLSVSQPSVVVPANGSATVEVNVDPAALPRGRHGGYLEAVAGDTVVHTSLGAHKEAPTHKVTLTGIGPDGAPATVNPVVLYGADSRYDTVGHVPAGGSVTVTVAEGTHYLNAVIASGRAPDEQDSVITDPQLTVDRDMTVVLDARKAKRLQIKTPKPAVQKGILSFYTHREFANRRITNTQMEFDGTRYVAVTPTARATDGSYEFGSRWGLVAPMLTTSVRGAGWSPELFYLGRSPALDGTRRLPVVNVGAGAPADYTGRDVRGKIALVHGTTLTETAIVNNAADAGVAFVILVPSQTQTAYTQWLPHGDRIRAMGAKIRQADGARLLSLLERGPVTLDLKGTPVSPYLYDVHQVSEQQVPDGIVHAMTEENSATVTTDYHDNGGIGFAKEMRFSWRPWATTANLQYQRWMPTPQTRQEIVSAGDITWMHRVKYYHSWESLQPLAGGMLTEPLQYRPGQRVRESWHAPVARPAVPKGVPAAAPYREGDVLTIRIPAWADAESGHYGLPEGGLGEPVDKGAMRLYRDGTQVAQGSWAWGAFPAGQGPATYRLEQDVTRTTPEWQFGYRTETAWTFRSAPSAQRALLPLLQLDYAIDTDLSNRTAANRSQPLGLTVRYPDGLPKPGLTGVTVWASYDDGGTWRKVPVAEQSGGRYAAQLTHPRLDRTTGYVSLRVQATDRDGGAIEQTVLRAFGLR